MSEERFDPGLLPGQILTGEDLRTAFACEDRGGLRWSQQTQTLVMISDQFDAIDPDRWDGPTLHFAVLDQPGDQALDDTRIGRLTEPGGAGAAAYLFERLGPDQYLFDGTVALAGAPQRESRADEEGRTRDAWVLPLRLVGRQEPPALPAGLAEGIRNQKERRARHLNQVELARRAALTHERPEPRMTLATTYSSDAYVAELARRRAAGHCQLCGDAAPFRAKGGRPFLEVHHVLRLSRGGRDTLDNTAALCPNCHRRMHVLDHETDRVRLVRALQEPAQPGPSEPPHPRTATDAEVEEFYEALMAEAQAQALPPLSDRPDDGPPL